MVKNNLRKLRVERQLTQRQVGIGADVTEAAISYLESGKRRPSPLVADRIARFLGVEVEDVFPGFEEKEAV